MTHDDHGRRLHLSIGLLMCFAISCATPDGGEPVGLVRQQLSSLSHSLIDVVDENPDPGVFQATLSVDEQDVTIDGTVVHSIIYKDANTPSAYAGTPDGLPLPQIVVDVGDEVIVTLTNDLASDCAAIACASSIHWHGLELDNDSDGTGVTQNRIEPGQSYTYRFYAPRPGVFWFHPHMLPGAQVFAGAYGAFIVRDKNETALQGAQTIPAEGNTHTVVLSDTEFDADGDVGYLDGSEAVAWATVKSACAATGAGCTNIADANTVLVNGRKPDGTTPVITAASGSGIRLRLINTSTHRYFRLRVDNNGSDNNLYRIGGEGGFLEEVRLEGGTLGSWDTKIDPGEILVSSSGRADVVIVPTGADGDVITIVGDAFSRGGPSSSSAAGELLRIVIDDDVSDTPFTIAAGNDVLGAGGVEDIKGVAITDFYMNPIPALPGPGSGVGSFDDTLVLEGIEAGKLAIDGVIGHFEDSGPDYTQVPYQGATRYARTGDTLEFTVSNATNQHHPFHHHGFSFQPVRLLDNGDDSVLYEFDYAEFVDVVDIPKATRMVLRMRLDDRPRITDNRQEMAAPAPDQFFASGGAAGRWVMHCHLFLHASIGMITELVVVDTDRDGDGLDTSEDCDDFDPAIPADAEVCDDGKDNDCNGITDTDCNHPPVADAGDDQGVECAQTGGAPVALDGTGSSDVDGDALSYAWSAPGIVFDDPSSPTPSAVFPLGTTTVTLTVSDGEFDDSDEVVIEVVDTTAPELTLSVDPSQLWPPNHKMVNVSVSAVATDVCDPNPTVVLVSATSSEPDNGLGDGNTVDDIQGAQLGTADASVLLRAERSGAGPGRVYSLGYTATDASDNQSAGSAFVTVPHSR